MGTCYRIDEYTYGGLKTKGIVYGVEEIDLKTFVVIIEWFEHFQVKYGGTFF